jgi:hypothetical protein
VVVITNRNPLLPTQIRQRELYQSKVFLCQCERCLDLTGECVRSVSVYAMRRALLTMIVVLSAECHLRAFPCRSCNKGLLMPLPLTQASIESEEDRWRCDNEACGRIVGFTQDMDRVEGGLVRRFEEAHAALDATQDIGAALQQLEAIVADHAGSAMHPHHYLLLQIYLLHGELLRKKLDGRLPALPAASASQHGAQPVAALNMNDDQRSAIRKQIETGLRMAQPLEAVTESLLPARHPLKAELYEGKAILLARLRQVCGDHHRPTAAEADVATLLAEAERTAGDNRRLFPTDL